MNPEPAFHRTERTIINLRDKGFNHAYIIGKYVYAGARAKLTTHAHPGMIEICYCDKGEQIYQVGEEVYKIRGGDVFITFPNELHGTAEHPEDKGSLYWVQIQLPAAGQKEFLAFTGDEAKVLVNSLLNIPVRHFKANSSIKKLLESILFKCAGEIDGIGRLSVYNYLTSFLLQVIQNAKDPKRTIAINGRMEKVKKFIEKNINSDLSVAILADQENISESHFKSIFKKECGIPPMDYVLRKKIDVAKSRLSDSDYTSITEVAHHLGFCSSQYFSTVFKKYTGLTPQKFRTQSNPVSPVTKPTLDSMTRISKKGIEKQH